MHLRALILLLMAIMLCGCQHGKIQTEDGRVLETHGASAKGLDDPLEAKVTVKVGHIGFLMGGSAESFYRGYIEKATLRPTYQLYIVTNSSEWEFWDKVKFLSPDGLKEYPVARVGRDVQCGQSGCAHYEDVVLRLDGTEPPPYRCDPGRFCLVGKIGKGRW